MEKFDILFDKSVYTITIAVIIVLVLVMAFTLFLNRKQGKKIIPVITGIIVIVPVLIALFFIPRSYSVSTQGIVIQKVIGKISLDENDIRHVSIISANDLQGVYRTFASGGFGGYFGKYSSPKYGTIRVYAGSLSKNLVMIQLKDNTSYLITPKDLVGFLEKAVHSDIRTDFSPTP